MALKKSGGKYVPLKLFRYNKAVAVSDLSSSLWCEVQVEYRKLFPYLKQSREWTRRAKEGKEVQQRTKAMTDGAAIHLQKGNIVIYVQGWKPKKWLPWLDMTKTELLILSLELEVHKIAEIHIVTKEDRWAVDLMKTYSQLSVIKEGGVEREIKVFGDPYDTGTIASGIIDQIQYCPSENTLIISELKTRIEKSIPHAETLRMHSLQVMVYKSLLDLFTQGQINIPHTLGALSLRTSQRLTHGPLNYMEQIGLASLLNWDPKKGKLGMSLGDLAEAVGTLIAGLGLPLAGSLMLQYEHQESREILGYEGVIHDEDWAKKEVRKSLEFWCGERASVGVDIEDSWKCDYCQFADICVWKKR